MNKYSLRFKSDQLESRYQEETRSYNNRVFMNILVTYVFIVAIPCVIIGSVFWNLSDVIIYSLAGTVGLAYHFVTKKFPRQYNLWVNSLNVVASIAMGGQILLFGPTTGIDDQCVLFFFGAAGFSLHITVAFLSANFLMTFGQVLTTAFIYYVAFWSTDLYAYKFAYGAFSVFILFTIYTNQKNKREIFLLREYEREWAQIVKKGLTQSIITVKYNQKNNFITLDMVNDQARKLLQLQNSDQFKEFSRKTLVFENFKDYEDTTTSNHKLDNRSQFTPNLQGMKFDEKIKNTLENRIISIIKQTIQKKSKLQANHYSPTLTNKMSQLHLDVNLASSYDAQSTGAESQVEDTFYGVFKKSDGSIEKRISIKASSFQNQTDYFCCLVIEEETNKQKVKILEGINKNFEKTFFQFCFYVGEKLSNIVINLKDECVIKANISQCYNTIYNFKDHVNLLKNQFKLKVDNLTKTQTTLGQLKSQILSRFIDKFHIIALKIDLVNCNPDTQICTYVDKLNQLIMNLVENSIKFQQSSNSMIKYKGTSKINFPIRKCSKSQTYASEFKNNNQLRQMQYVKNIQSGKDNTNTSFRSFIQEKNAVNNENEYQQQNNIDQQDNQNSRINQNSQEVNIKLELIKGEAETSNIIKITVKDYGKGMSTQRMLQMLETIGTKSPAYNQQYQNYNFLGWKINYHIIGNIGPFYNFYVKSKENQGLEYQFYIFQDIGILNSQQRQSTVFSNSSFQIDYDISNSCYYHINNIISLKENIRKQSQETQVYKQSQETQILKQSNNGLLQQSIKQSFINQLNLHQNFSKINSMSSSINEDEQLNFSQEVGSGSSTYVPSKNLNYQLNTRLFSQKHLKLKVEDLQIKSTNDL